MAAILSPSPSFSLSSPLSPSPPPLHVPPSPVLVLPTHHQQYKETPHLRSTEEDVNPSVPLSHLFPPLPTSSHLFPLDSSLPRPLVSLPTTRNIHKCRM
ncbi:unnamed protein product [Closterium sp. NIES-54]